MLLRCQNAENKKGMPFTMYGGFRFATFANSYTYKIYSTKSTFSCQINWCKSRGNCSKTANLFKF